MRGPWAVKVGIAATAARADGGGVALVGMEVKQAGGEEEGLTVERFEGEDGAAERLDERDTGGVAEVEAVAEALEEGVRELLGDDDDGGGGVARGGGGLLLLLVEDEALAVWDGGGDVDHELLLDDRGLLRGVLVGERGRLRARRAGRMARRW